jgi:Protein of unknown function (DUF3800)
MTSPWLVPRIPPPATTRPPRVTLRRDHPTCTGFLDESGMISADRYFCIGMVKTSRAPQLLRGIQKLRDQLHWYKEIKWYDITRGSVDQYKKIIDVCFVDKSLIEFWCFVADRQTSDPIARFGSQWDAYGKLAEQLVVASLHLHPNELISLMADNYSTPDTILFEEDLQASVNRRLNRLAVVSVVRLDSRSSDGLQVSDLLTSAVLHEFRVSAGLANASSPKGLVAAHVRSALGTRSCLTGSRNSQHSVQVYHG